MKVRGFEDVELRKDPSKVGAGREFVASSLPSLSFGLGNDSRDPLRCSNILKTVFFRVVLLGEVSVALPCN